MHDFAWSAGACLAVPSRPAGNLHLAAILQASPAQRAQVGAFGLHCLHTSVRGVGQVLGSQNATSLFFEELRRSRRPRRPVVCCGLLEALHGIVAGCRRLLEGEVLEYQAT